MIVTTNDIFCHSSCPYLKQETCLTEPITETNRYNQGILFVCKKYKRVLRLEPSQAHTSLVESMPWNRRKLRCAVCLEENGEIEKEWTI